MYKSLAGYEEAVRQSVNECVEKGLLLEEDRAACMRYCVAEAKKWGLV